jgi:hypothetical protein
VSWFRRHLSRLSSVSCHEKKNVEHDILTTLFAQRIFFLATCALGSPLREGRDWQMGKHAMLAAFMQLNRLIGAGHFFNGTACV